MNMGKLSVISAVFIIAVLAASLFAGQGFGKGIMLKQGSDDFNDQPDDSDNRGVMRVSGDSNNSSNSGKGRGWVDRMSTLNQRVKDFGLKIRQGLAVASGKGKYLDVRGEHLACRLDFTAAIVDDVISAVPEASGSLSGISSELADDKSQLAALSVGDDAVAFNSFVSGTIRPDMTEAIRLLAQERRNYRDYGFDNETTAQLRNSYQVALQGMKDCEKGAVGSLGQSRIDHYNSIIAQWQSTTDSLATKNVSVSAIQAVIDGAKTSVIIPLQNAVATGDSEQIKSALNTYCLGNGCEGGNGTSPQNYHGFAKINLERLQAIKNKLESSGTSTYLSQAQGELDLVRSTLSSVGSAKMDSSQEQSIWENLRDAARLIRDHIRSKATAAGAS